LAQGDPSGPGEVSALPMAGSAPRAVPVAERPLRFAVLLVAFTVGWVGASGLEQLDVHAQADKDLTAVAMRLNEKLTELCPGNQVTFGEEGCCTPHNTLYLTAFEEKAQAESYAAIGRAIAPVADAFVAPCSTTMKPLRASGAFVMWDLELNTCLQSLSDLVVSQLQHLALQNQSVPQWVYELEEPARSQKIIGVRLFGSPNVFFQYGPHVTIGWVDDDCKGFEGGLAAAVEAAYASVPEAARAESVVESIAYAVAGDHGTVPRGKELGVLPLVQEPHLQLAMV